MPINDKGKRFDHQRRLPSESLKESKESLFKIMTRLNASKDFAELHDLIKKHSTKYVGLVSFSITTQRCAWELSLSFFLNVSIFTEEREMVQKR